MSAGETWEIMVDQQGRHVIVVGGGFAGVACAKRLSGVPDVQVTLLDKAGYHQFQPLLYQVATAELAADDIRHDLAYMFRESHNVDVRTAEVTSIDPSAPSVTLSSGETLNADTVVLAAGAQPSFFHTPGAWEHAFPLYSLNDAERVRAQILKLFAEAAERPEAVEEGALTFVIIGGGPTGVETAGALGDLIQDVMPHVYEHSAVAGARVILVDLGHAVLSAFSDEAHTYAAKQLQRRGVRLMLGVSAKEITPEHVVLSDGTVIKTRLVVWGGGEKAAPIAANAGVSQGRGGRIDVLPDLTVAGFPSVYAVGDVANIPFGDEPALPQLGSVAQQAGDWAGQNILTEIDGGPRQAFYYRDKGIMAMIGRNAAIAEVGAHRHELHGRLAFAAWLGVHAELLGNLPSELRAFVAWSEEFYLRPHHRRGSLLDLTNTDSPRIDRKRG